MSLSKHYTYGVFSNAKFELSEKPLPLFPLDQVP